MSFTVAKSLLTPVICSSLSWDVMLKPTLSIPARGFLSGRCKERITLRCLVGCTLVFIPQCDILVFGSFCNRQHQWFMFILWSVMMPGSFSGETCLVIAPLVFWVILTSCSQLLSWMHRSPLASRGWMCIHHTAIALVSPWLCDCMTKGDAGFQNYSCHLSREPQQRGQRRWNMIWELVHC